MKIKLSILTIVLLSFGVLVFVVMVPFVKGKTGNKVAEINTTWGEFLDLHMKENPQEEYYNPNQNINKDRKVQVIKAEYPNGLESKAGFFNYALITRVYDAKTRELLTSEGVYRDKK